MSRTRHQSGKTGQMSRPQSIMVDLFFAIPGCVLSARGLKLVKHGKMSEFLSSLISSVFMRWLRWHLRVIASMCIALFISRMEW
jgi:hypothetical protein